MRSGLRLLLLLLLLMMMSLRQLLTDRKRFLRERKTMVFGAQWQTQAACGSQS